MEEMKPSYKHQQVLRQQQQQQQQGKSAGGNGGLTDAAIGDSLKVSSCVHLKPDSDNLLMGELRAPNTLQLMDQGGGGSIIHGSSGRDGGVPESGGQVMVSSGAFGPVGNSRRVKRRGSPIPAPPPRGIPFRATPVTSQSLLFQSQAQSIGSHGAFQPVVPSDQTSVPRPVPNHSWNSNDGATQQHDDLGTHRPSVREWGNKPLAQFDPDLWDLMEKEKHRQWKGIELIASENFTSLAVIEALGSHLTNKYSEGLPGHRYYKGNQFIDQIESLCCSRALTAFHLEADKWGVNVQPYSCSTANFAVYTALLQPQDRIMGLDVLSGGHVSHGYHTHSGKKISAASIYFQSLPFKVDPETGLIDYEKLEETALLYRPKILICGGSSYPREWDYARFRQIADKVNAILMCDMAHISGLVVAQECQSPFEHCDIVTSTTHKSLRGPRGGIIFYRKGPKPHKRPGDEIYNFEKDINFAIHPTLQGGPHNNHIAALAAALKQAATPEFKEYMQQVKKNAQALAEGLKKRGCKLVTDGTDNHLMLWDLRPFGVAGNLFEEVCEACHITVNKNAVYGDSSALQPGGIRIGTPAMTSRGCLEADFDTMASFLHKAMQITLAHLKGTAKLQREFTKGLQTNSEIVELRAKVEKFAALFEMPGFDVGSMKYYNS
ncbi:hypothetical protein CY35_05G085100 [Sphagnum magellanicum]|nr:hypothetical protein CY35_05G085100 [Sphagnum magellanicum]